MNSHSDVSKDVFVVRAVATKQKVLESFVKKSIKSQEAHMLSSQRKASLLTRKKNKFAIFNSSRRPDPTPRGKVPLKGKLRGTSRSP